VAASETETPRTPDYQLTQRAAEGDMKAFEELYQRHNRRVYSLCLRMTGNVTEAEDLAQEVFIQLFRKIGSFRGESAFTTWLHRVTVNLVLMSLRRWAIRQERQMSDDFETRISTLFRNRQSPSARITDRIALDSALAQLAPGCRSVFVLFDVEGYQHREIARLLGCTTGTSKSQLHRARKKLKRLLTSTSN